MEEERELAVGAMGRGDRARLVTHADQRPSNMSHGGSFCRRRAQAAAARGAELIIASSSHPAAGSRRMIFRQRTYAGYDRLMPARIQPATADGRDQEATIAGLATATQGQPPATRIAPGVRAHLSSRTAVDSFTVDVIAREVHIHDRDLCRSRTTGSAQQNRARRSRHVAQTCSNTMGLQTRHCAAEPPSDGAAPQGDTVEIGQRGDRAVDRPRILSRRRTRGRIGATDLGQRLSISTPSSGCAWHRRAHAHLYVLCRS